MAANLWIQSLDRTHVVKADDISVLSLSYPKDGVHLSAATRQDPNTQYVLAVGTLVQMSDAQRSLTTLIGPNDVRPVHLETSGGSWEAVQYREELRAGGGITIRASAQN